MADSNEELVQTMKSAEASEGADRDHSRTRLIAGGGILGALAASSCCILPMAGGPHHDCVSCSYAVVIWRPVHLENVGCESRRKSRERRIPWPTRKITI